MTRRTNVMLYCNSPCTLVYPLLLTEYNHENTALGHNFEIVFLAPFREEFLFRGAVLRTVYDISRSYSASVAVSSSLFSLVHLFALIWRDKGEVVLQAVTGLFAGGLYSAVMMEPHSSLYDPLLMHTVNNIVSLSFPAKLADYSSLHWVSMVVVNLMYVSMFRKVVISRDANRETLHRLPL